MTKLLKEHIEENICDIELGKEFLDTIPNVQALTEKKQKKINWNLLKLEMLVLQKTSFKKMQNKPHTGEKYLQVMSLMKDLHSEYIKPL